jgi:N-acetylmuramoyl-L-alanine amidase
MSIFKRGTLQPQNPTPTPLPEPKPPGRLAIIVGHQKSAQGASSLIPIGMSEYMFHTKIIVPLLEKECDAVGIDYKVFLRDGSDIGGVGAAVSAWAANDPRCVAVELHFNASGAGAIGSEVLYDSWPTDNTKFATLVHNRICQALGRVGKSDRGIKRTDSGRGSHNLTSVKCIGCLVEPFFGDVKSECELMWSRKESYAKAIIAGVVDYLS